MSEPKSKPLHHIGFSHAWEGLTHTFTSHPNFKIHLAISTLALALAVFLEVSTLELGILLLCVTLGLTIELVNTAIESVVDLVTQEWRQSAKLAKDISSGAMLVTAIGTAVVGILILAPKLIKIFLNFDF